MTSFQGFPSSTDILSVIKRRTSAINVVKNVNIINYYKLMLQSASVGSPSVFLGRLNRVVFMKVRWVKALVVAVACAVSAPAAAQSFTTNTFSFTYANRNALLAAGWSFIAVSSGAYGSTPRNTEITNSANGAVVSYDQTAHPGVLRIPVDQGDLWEDMNNSRNTLFQNLASNWVSVRLKLSFVPSQNYQQANLVVYQDDDNYVEVGHAYNVSESVELTQEMVQHAQTVSSIGVAATNMYLRLDRDLNTDIVSAFYSLDGTNWVTVGQVWQTLLNPQVAIFCGGSNGGFPNADLQRLDVITLNNPPPAVLILQPQHLVFNAMAGQPCTNVQNINVVVRSQDPPVQWSVTNSSSWLLTNEAAGGTPGTCQLSVDTTGLAPGIYQAGLGFGASNSIPALENVTLIVNPNSRARVSTWQGGKAGAMSVSVDDSNPTAFDELSTNGLRGSYMIWDLTPVPSFFTNYYLAGMEMGSHTVDHPSYAVNEAALRFEIESNIASIVASTPASPAEVISFAWPWGFTDIQEEVVAADYFLGSRGYNINQLENPTPSDFMNLKCYNSHEHFPYPPADLKTCVDAAVAQGQWFNLVLHTTNDSDGAITYSTSQDIWVAPIGSVVKYILQRDRTVISNYVENASFIQFDCYRLPLDPSGKRSFETAIGTNDVLTFQMDVSGIPSLFGLTTNGVACPYTNRIIGGTPFLLFNMPVTVSPQSVLLALSTNQPPVLPVIPPQTVNELTLLTVTNTASDSDFPAPVLTYQLINPPAGALIDTNGIITWTPSEGQGPGSYTITTVVTDNGTPNLSATNNFTVLVNEVNVAPVLTLPPNTNINEQVAWSATATASDSDIPPNPLTFALVSGPAGLTVTTNGVITWTPAQNQSPGSYTVTISVTDTNPAAVNAKSLSTTNSFQITVKEVNVAPVLPVIPI